MYTDPFFLGLVGVFVGLFLFFFLLFRKTVMSFKDGIDDSRR
ncbi:hypothetical protein ACFQH2_03875 [Natronoarchaeum sp. GCM10025703]